MRYEWEKPDIIQIWVFPQMVVPPKHPKMIIFSGKTHGFVGETHHFRSCPHIVREPFAVGFLSSVAVVELWLLFWVRFSGLVKWR